MSNATMSPTAQIRQVEAPLALLAGPSAGVDADVLRQAAVRVGNRVEIDLVDVARLSGNDAAERLATYRAACQLFWARWDAGASPGPFVAVSRTLTDRSQDTRKGHKLDLRDELDALEQMPGIGQFVTELLGADPDRRALVTLGAPLSATVEHDGSATVATLRTDADVPWAAPLGGLPTRGEVRRTVQVHARHAAWRDRRVRRLARVVVTVEEIWPDPAHVLG